MYDFVAMMLFNIYVILVVFIYVNHFLTNIFCASTSPASHIYFASCLVVVGCRVLVLPFMDSQVATPC